MKKSELRKLIKEVIADYYEWGDEFQRFAEKKLKKMKFKGWNFSVNGKSGTFEFRSDNGDTYIFATPAWDGEAIIPVDVYSINDESKPFFNKSYSLKGYEDFNKAFKYYSRVINTILKRLER